MHRHVAIRKNQEEQKNNLETAALRVQKWATKALKRAFPLNSTALRRHCYEKKGTFVAQLGIIVLRYKEKDAVIRVRAGLYP